MERFDMETFLESAGYAIRRIGGKTANLLSKCPFCSKEWHCGISFDRKTFGCFKCHQAGDFFRLLQKVLKLGFLDTVEFLKSGVSSVYVNVNYIDRVVGQFRKYESIEDRIKPIPLPEGYRNLHNKRIPYLDTGRKFPILQEDVNYYKMGICHSGFHVNRLIVCDVNDQDQIIYWIARDITGKVPKSWKVLNPSAEVTGVGSADLLFNYYKARNYKTGILTEGVFDSIHTGPCAMATYGTGLKESHMYWLLKARFEEIILLYDPDVKWDYLEDMAIQILQHIPVRICQLKDGDPDEHPRDVLWQYICSAPSFRGSKLDRITVCVN